jgi:hypothetical protein
MMSHESLDGSALENRRATWRDRRQAPRADQYVCTAGDGTTMAASSAVADHDPSGSSHIGISTSPPPCTAVGSERH